MKFTALAALTAALLTPFPALAKDYKPEIEVPGTVAAYICLYQTGYISTIDAAGEAAYEELISKGYTPTQILNLAERSKHHITRYTNDYCEKNERTERLKGI